MNNGSRLYGHLVLSAFLAVGMFCLYPASFLTYMFFMSGKWQYWPILAAVFPILPLILAIWAARAEFNKRSEIEAWASVRQSRRFALLITPPGLVYLLCRLIWCAIIAPPQKA